MQFEENEETFITLLEEEVRKGDRPTTTLTNETQKNVQTKLNESTGKKFTVDQLKNKFNSLRACHKEFNCQLRLRLDIVL